VTITEMVAASRIELASPRAQKPSYRHLLHLSVGVVQSFFNRMANTGRAWTIGETVLSVSSGTDTCTLSGNIGKVLDVVTYDPDNQEGTERQVPFHELSDLSGDFRGLGASIAFYRKNGQDTLYAKVRPIPTENADYYVSYSVGAWAQDASLDDSPLLAQHHHLLVCQIARDALPAAEWSNDPKADDYKRQSLERSLSRRIESYERDFGQYIAGLNVPRITYREEAFAIE